MDQKVRSHRSDLSHLSAPLCLLLPSLLLDRMDQTDPSRLLVQ